MVKRFMAPGPWITRDLKPCVLASDYDNAIVMLKIMVSLAENSSGLTGDAEEAIREARALCSQSDAETNGFTTLCAHRGADCNCPAGVCSQANAKGEST